MAVELAASQGASPAAAAADPTIPSEIARIFTNALDPTGFPARWNCGEWSPPLGYLHIVSDLLIWSAYMAIPIVIASYTLRRRDVLFPAVAWLFAGFIFACGTTHLIEAIIFYTPIYRLSGIFKLGTAAVSWATVIALIPLVPKAIKIPGIHRMNQRLAEEILEHERTERELRAAQELMDAKNRELEQFAYSVSHDLRSPLVTIRNLLNVMERDAAAGRTDRNAELLTLATRTATRMSDTVEDLLELSRAGTPLTAREPVDLGDAARDAVEARRPDLERLGFVVRIAPDLPRISADRARVRQIFDNLVGNAIKYAAGVDAPQLEFSAKMTQDDVSICIRDNGPGIPKRHHDRVFRLFERLDNDSEGTGVGLALVQRAAEVMGGRVWLDSDEGRGCAFWLVFPRSLLV